jgi:hypothetical protein
MPIPLINLIREVESLLNDIKEHPEYLEIQENGYEPDLKIEDAETALTYLEWKIDEQD